MASSVRRRGRPGAAPSCHLAPVRWRWPHSSGRRRRHGRHATPHSPSVHSFALPLSLATPTPEAPSPEAPSPLLPRASRAPCALTCASRHLSERLRYLLHLLAGRDFPEMSRISQDYRHRVHGRCDPDSGEPRRCSIHASFLLSKSR